MSERISIAVMHGNARGEAPCGAIALWAGSRIWERRGFTLDLIEPPFPRADGDTEALSALRRRLLRAEAIIIVTPALEPSASSTQLEQLLEHTATAWRARPVAFICHGDGDGGTMAPQPLREKLAERQAVMLDDDLRLGDSHGRFDSDGELPASDPAQTALDVLLERLHRQALDLRNVRTSPRRQTQSVSAETD